MLISDDFLICKDLRSQEDPMISLILCSYNQGEFVNEGVAAAEEVRKVLNAEIIFIDDGSKDESFKNALASLESSNNYFVGTKKNCGLVHSLNLGLKMARGKYSIFLAIDDKLVVEGVSTACRQLEIIDQAGFFIANAMYFGEGIERNPVYKQQHLSFFRTPINELKPITPSKLPPPLLIQATVFRTKFLINLGGWHSDVILDDLPLFLRIFSKDLVAGQDFLYDLKVNLCEYRQHGNNSHVNVLRIYNLYEECIFRYCDPASHKIELSSAIGMYLLNSIRLLNWRAAFSLLKKAIQYRVLFNALLNAFERLLAKLKNKVFVGDSGV
ncbi:glycosyltransferase family 2 protein [Flavobacterium sp.]|uniref:glycosyltransferase family 2 protein n=1 Tax=Flavobacterium sp. TaxID=239 RepID=UPI0035B31D3D